MSGGDDLPRPVTQPLGGSAFRLRLLEASLLPVRGKHRRRGVSMGRIWDGLAFGTKAWEMVTSGSRTRTDPDAHSKGTNRRMLLFLHNAKRG